MSSRILLTCAALCAAPAFAAELNYAVRAGVTHSDNVERLPEGLERSAQAATVGLELDGERDTGRARYQAVADLAYYEYFNHDFDSELLGRAALEGAYHFLPERLSWNARFTYDQVREDLLRPLASGNRESQVVFSTGPTLRARLGGAMEAQIDGRYTRLGYSQRPFDSETVGGRALLGRRASPASLLALGYSFDDVGYVSSSAPPGLDYERQEMFARAELQGVRTTLQGEAGYSKITGALVDDGGLMARLYLSRRLTPSLSGFATYVREYPTSEETLAGDPAAPGEGVSDPSVLTAAPRLASRIEVGARIERPRSSAELAVGHRRESAVDAVGTREYDDLRGRVSRNLTPRSTAAVQVALVREEISLTGSAAKEFQAGVQYGLTFGRAVGIDLRVDYHDRDGATAGDTYSEFSAGVFLRYGGRIGRSPQP